MMKNDNYYIPKTFATAGAPLEKSRLPFAPKTYVRTSARFDLPEAGFPTVKVPVRPWIPGVSTPEGVILASATSLLVVNVISESSELLFHLAQGFASLLMVGIVGGIPTSAVLLSSKLFTHHT